MNLNEQQRRVLRSLQTAGPKGITRVDWNGTRGTPDNGPPILNFAARILELRQKGYPVEASGDRRDRCKVFVCARQHKPLPAVPDAAARLFTPPAADAIRGVDAA